MDICRTRIWIRRRQIDDCKNGIIWSKVIRRSIPTQDSRSTEGYWLPFHKRGPDVWIRLLVKPDGTEYNEMVLCYVDNVLTIWATPMKTIEGIKALFKLKGEKAEVPDMYVGASIQKVETADSTECWMIFAEKHVKVP